MLTLSGPTTYNEAGGTAARKTFSCTPHALALRLAVSSAGAEIYSTALSVAKPRVDLAFASGTVVVEFELEPEKAPITVDNFLAYVNSGYYNATLIHRVVAGFVNQGGGYSAVAATTLTAKPGLSPAIVLETNKGLGNTRGSIAMARTSVADSASSQFFFNQVDNPSLDYASAGNPGYAVFSRVVSGQAVLDAIDAVATRTVGAFANVPLTDIFVQTAVQSQQADPNRRPGTPIRPAQRSAASSNKPGPALRERRSPTGGEESSQDKAPRKSDLPSTTPLWRSRA